MAKHTNEDVVSIARESNTTWDIIAELSKQATTDVHTMLLRHYTAHANPGDNVGTCNKYMSYPEEDILQLVALFKMQKFVDELQIPEEDDTAGSRPVTSDAAAAPKRKKKGSKKPTIPRRDQIRHEQIKLTAAKAAPFFARKERNRLNPLFRSNVVEVIIMYYMNVTHYTFTKRNITEFMDAVISFRDAFVYFESQMLSRIRHIATAYFAHIQKTFPWQSLLSSNTHFLLNNHFKRTFQRAPKPFREQAALLDAIRDGDPHRLFVLPWGVGTGKTAMLPPLTEIYRQKGLQTIYCVPFGPVRDQAAALLYRCGIPFAYVVPSASGCIERFELQPSFMCGEGTIPVALIVHPEFVQYYTEYWAAYSDLVGGNNALLDPVENPPSVYLPSKKPRYAHLTHQIWNTQYALVLDEPSENNPHVTWILNHLPETAFVMSATSWSLVSENVRDMYTSQYDKVPVVVEASTVGVSTTLIGSWLKDKPVLSPFSGIRTRKAFQQRLRFIRDKVLWRRFLSAAVMVDWLRRVRTIQHESAAKRHLDYAFDLYELSFDSLSERVVVWCDNLAQDDTLTDPFYAEMFGLDELDTEDTTDVSALLERMLTTDSRLYLGGCIIGVPDVSQAYDTIGHLLDDFPTVHDVDMQLETYRKDTASRYENWKKFPITKATDVLKKHDLLKGLEDKRKSVLPIDEALIVNTGPYIERITGQPAPTTTKLTRAQEFVEVGDPLQDVDGWQVFADKMKGNFEHEFEDQLRWRWKGVGGITMHKEFNMKNIRDSDKGYLAFLIVDAIGAHGLNLKIKHGILMKGADGSMLSSETCLQMAGRVGRWGQDSTGLIHVTDRDIFESVFAH